MEKTNEMGGAQEVGGMRTNEEGNETDSDEKESEEGEWEWGGRMRNGKKTDKRVRAQKEQIQEKNKLQTKKARIEQNHKSKDKTKEEY